MKAIEGSPKCIGDIFKTYEFEIPEFQRPYSWGRDECEQLCQDLFGFLGEQAGSEKYFLGCIVVYPKSENSNMLRVIDGQQRLTTLLMLLHLIFQKMTDHTILEKMIYKTDLQTGDAEIGNPRIESLVLGRKDRNSLQKVLSGDIMELDEKDQFHFNYKCMEDFLDKWWRDKSAEQCKKITGVLQHNIMMLPIQCTNEDDALTLFQIINDRGKSLDDSDIFKAQIYNAVSDGDRREFINRWDKMEGHESLFRVYMYISRAEKNDTGTEIRLRKYMLENHLKDRDTLAQNYGTIMESLETCYWRMSNNNSSDNKKISAEENIYWGILASYPNVYWQYPLYVFLDRYMQRKDAGFCLSAEQSEEYVRLMRETVRYCLIRGVVYNRVNAIKDTIFKVCAAICKGTDYADAYRKNTSQEDIEKFYQSLEDSSYGKRYRKGLVLLNSFLNSRQNLEDYGTSLQGKWHIEHILPREYNHYDKWSDNQHEKSIDKIGNLMPLEQKINIKAGNEFFSRKKKEYKKSKFQDALDLAQKNSEHWYPEDLEKRHTEAIERLREFFDNDAF